MKYILLATLAIISIKQAYTQNQSFNFEGETLKYNAKYGFIKGGEVIISSKKVKWDENKLKPNDVLIFPIYFDEKINNTRVVYRGKEQIKQRGKVYKCHKFTPIFSGIKMFSKEGVAIYFTDDYKRRPVLIKVNFRVGSFKVEIVD